MNMDEPKRRPRIGEMIVYRVFGGEYRACRITEVCDDVKNGWPGFDGVTPEGMSVWGYDDQIVDDPRIREVMIG